jgi:hypothetical protein
LRKTISVTAGATYTVTIGAGGAAGTSGSVAGSVGTDTTFGSLATGFGGGGGNSVTDNAGFTLGTVRATSSGAPSGTNFGGNNFNSASGGAGGNAMSFFNMAGTVGKYLISSSSTTGPLQGGAGSVSGNGPVHGGIGIDGFGGGGTSGAMQAFSANTRADIASSGAGLGGLFDGQGSAVGNAGTANKGGGGGGGHRGATTVQSTAGGAGGSGYAYVTYWS